MTEAKPKILQIIAAERGWHARVGDPSFLKEVLCWALCDDGQVWPMVEGDCCPELTLNHEYLLNPGASWRYCIQADQPEDDDWEACGFTQDADGEPLVLWRQAYK